MCRCAFDKKVEIVSDDDCFDAFESASELVKQQNCHAYRKQAHLMTPLSGREGWWAMIKQGLKIMKEKTNVYMIAT